MHKVGKLGNIYGSYKNWNDAGQLIEESLADGSCKEWNDAGDLIREYKPQ